MYFWNTIVYCVLSAEISTVCSGSSRAQSRDWGRYALMSKSVSSIEMRIHILNEEEGHAIVMLSALNIHIPEFSKDSSYDNAVVRRDFTPIRSIMRMLICQSNVYSMPIFSPCIQCTYFWASIYFLIKRPRSFILDSLSFLNCLHPLYYTVRQEW